MTDDPNEVATGSPRRDAPRFACFPDGDDKHSYFIFVEGNTLCNVPSFTKAFMIMVHYTLHCKNSGVPNTPNFSTPFLLAAFSVFNIRYTYGCKNFYTTLEILMMGTTPETSPSVSRFVSALKSTEP